MLNRSNLLVVIGAASVAIAACTTVKSPATSHGIAASADPRVIERGRYLAHGPAHCISCHGNDFSGGRSIDLGVLGTVVAPNITSDSAAGIGALSDDTLVRSLRYGISRNGRPLVPLMSFSDLADEDLEAIISYLRTVPPVSRPAPEHRLSLLGTVGVKFLLGRQGPSTAPAARLAPTRTAAYGRYLAHALANCAGCHTQRSKLTGAFVGQPLAGGMTFDEPGGRFVAPDLRQIAAALDEGEFSARFRARGWAQERSPMPWDAYARMTDSDLGAIYRYLRTLSPE